MPTLPRARFSGFMKLYAVTICINYADYLECVIANLGHFDRWMVITVPMDGATHELCAKHGIECMDSTTLEEDGSDFNPVDNKARVLNEAMDALFWSSEKTDDETWMVVLDADVLLPRHFGERVRGLPLEKGCLYGMGGRKVCEHWEQFEMLKECEPWDTMAERNSQAIGYFNLFCTDARPDRYAIRSGESVWEHDDYLFTTSFAPEKRKMLPFTAIHLGNYGKNWKGRVTGKYGMRDEGDLGQDEDSEMPELDDCPLLSQIANTSSPLSAAVLGYYPGGRWIEFGILAGKTYLLDLFEIHTRSESALVESDRAVLRQKIEEEAAGLDLVMLDCADRAGLVAIPGGTLDLLYIPGEVSPDLLRELIPLWIPKLRNGAMICGDVYGLPFWANATHSIALMFGPPDEVKDGRWVKKFVPSLAAKNDGNSERGVIFNSGGTDGMEAMLVSVYAARKHWSGPIHIRHHGTHDESMLIALGRLGATVEWVAGDALHPQQMKLRSCLGSQFRQSLVLGREHLLTRMPSFRIEQSFGLGEALESEGPFLMESTGTNGSRRFALVSSEHASLLNGDDCDVIICGGEPAEWSERAWEHWCGAEAEATAFLAREIRVASGVTIVTIVTPEDAGDFQRNWLTWKFGKTPIIIVLVDVPLEGFWIPDAEAVKIIELQSVSEMGVILNRVSAECGTERLLFLPPQAAALPGAELWPDLPHAWSAVHFSEEARKEPEITGNLFVPACCFALVPMAALGEIAAGNSSELSEAIIEWAMNEPGKTEFSDLSQMGWKFSTHHNFQNSGKYLDLVPNEIIRTRPDGLLQLADAVVVISMPERADRQARIVEMMEREGIWFRFVDGVRVTNDEIQPFEVSEVGRQNFKLVAGFEKYLRGMVGCRRAHLRELEAAKAAGLRSLLIFEDDCVLNSDWREKLEAAVRELPPVWMQLHLSAMDFRPSSPVCQHLRRLAGAYQTTAILYSEAGIAAALNCLRHSRSEIDHWMGNHLHPFGNSYVVHPRIASQQGGVSDIMSFDRGVTA